MNNHWSPEQIAGRIILDNITNGVHISFTTIYKWIYHKYISKCSVKLLRRKGKSLRPKETRGKFNIDKTIKDRPREVCKRETLGHWELDTVVSSRGKSKACLSKYVKRKIPLLKIKIMSNRKADTFNKYCIEAFKTFNDKNIKTLTIDRGKEFAEYIKLEDSLKVDVYFADPYRSW